MPCRFNTQRYITCSPRDLGPNSVGKAPVVGQGVELPGWSGAARGSVAQARDRA